MVEEDLVRGIRQKMDQIVRDIEETSVAATELLKAEEEE
jgi:hypothetical protein